jgi:ligand-binding SRPBCC domain-containing protein
VPVDFTVRTALRAPADAAFAASLSVEDHLGSMARSRERAIGGITTGQIGAGQSVTWKARHFGITWTMTSQVTELQEPSRFVDEQIHGPFKTFRHEHLFNPTTDGIEMLDNIAFTAPFGALGWLVALEA